MGRGVVNLRQYIVNPASLTGLDATELMDVTPIMNPERVSQYVSKEESKKVSMEACKKVGK